MQVRDLELTAPEEDWVGTDPVRLSLLLHGVCVANAVLRGSAAHRSLSMARALRHLGRRPMLEALARRVIEHGLPPAEWATPVAPREVGPLPSLDIAICTRDRPGPLRITLDALVSRVPGGCRVLVVDNAPSNDETRRLVDALQGRVGYCAEPIPGLDHARNHALALSTAEVLAFVDDDAVIDPAWLPRMREAFSHPDVSMVTGLVEPYALTTEAERAFEAFGGFGRGFARQWLTAPRDRPIAWPWANTGRFGTGANLAFRRTMLRDIGGFDPALDAGTPSAGGGDLEAMFRVLKAGGLWHYAPQCRLRHMHRTSMAELTSQLHSWGTGMSAHIASLRQAFPDERGSLRVLDGWRYLRRLASRLLLAAVLRPFPISLAWAEARGTLEGAQLYRAGQRPGPARAWNPRPTGRPGVHDVAVDLATLEEPIHAPGMAAVRVTATVRGTPLGTLTLPACDGWLGRPRLCDAFIRHDVERILGTSAEAALAPIVHHVTRHG